MGITEIILLLAGGIVFILSFVIPAQKEEDHEETRGLAKEEIRNLVSEELESVRGHVDDVVEEAVTYSIEKTERSLERLSNEKIMAVSEYSDTVLSEIHKNHEEVMFLYDMLNDKHVNLKNTVSEVNKTVKEAEETKREAEEMVNAFQRLAPEAMAAAVVDNEGVKSGPPPQTVPFTQPVQPADLQHFVQSIQPIMQKQITMPKVQKQSETTHTVPLELIQPQISAFVRPAEPQQFARSVQPEQQTEPLPFLQPVQSEQQAEPLPFLQLMQAAEIVKPTSVPQETMPPLSVEPTAQMSTFMPKQQDNVRPEPAVIRGTALPAGTINFTQETDEQGRNYNDVILDLYKKGKSKVAIAKELNLGVGEVNLVIDLYKNM